MSVENGVIKAPINIKDPYKCLGVGPFKGCFDNSYICMHDKINEWSYIKPINSNTGLNDNASEIEIENSFKQSLTPIMYISGYTTPENFKYIYNKPTMNVFKRFSDFDGYNHLERPFQIVDLSNIPDVLDFDKTNLYIRIDHQGGGNNKVLEKIYQKQYPSSGNLFYNACIIIATKGSDKRVFVTRSRAVEHDDILIDFPTEDKELVKLFKEINIQDYICDIFAVIIPPNNFIDSNRGFHEIPINHRAYTYMCSPECYPFKPYKRGIKITRPRDRSYWNITIKDVGANYGDNNEFYIPSDSIISSALFIVPKDKTKPVENLFENSLTFQRWTQLTGDLFGGTIANGDFIREDYKPNMRGYIQIDWYNFGTDSRPNWVEPTIQIWSAGGEVYKVNTSVSKYTEVSWDNFIIGGETPNIDMRVGYCFRDPGFRPEPMQ